MALVPAGFPLWRRLNTFATYGGNVNKQNLGRLGAVNGQTDVDVTEFSAMVRDMGAAGRTVDWAQMLVQLDDTGLNDPTILVYEDLAGAGAPTSITRNADNDFTILWPVAPADPYGVTGTLNVIGGHVTIMGAAAGAGVVELLDPNTDTFSEAVRVRLFGIGGALVDPLVSLVFTTGQSV